MQRRKFLQVSGGLAALSTVPLSGCLGDSGDGDGSLRTLDWLPAPAELHEELEYYSMFSTAPATVQEYADQLSTETWENYQSKWLDWTIASPDGSEVTRYIEGSSPESLQQENDVQIAFIVVEHTLDTDELAGSIQEQGLEETETYREFDVYQSSDGTSIRALNDGRLVAALANDDGLGVAKTLIDTQDGTAERYEDSSETIDNITTTLETDHNFRFEDFKEITDTKSSLGIFEGSTGRGYSTTLEEDQISAKYVEKFAQGSNIRQENIETYTNEDSLFDGAENLEINVEGNTLILDWTANFGTVTMDQLG
jgi:hypothetical protein